MANDISKIVPQILAKGLLVLREKAIMPRLVNLSYGDEAAKKGAVIEIPAGAPATVTDVAPSAAPVQAAGRDFGAQYLTLDQWKESDFGLTDSEMAQIDINRHFMPDSVAQAVRAIANTVNAHIHSKYKGIYGAVGAAGTTPFSTADDAVNARKTLNKQLAPTDGRVLVLDPDAEAKALLLEGFADVSQAGSSSVKIDGEIGQKYGMNWYWDHAVPTHTAGTSGGAAGTGLKLAANALAGASVISVQAIAGNDGTLVEGDVITIAGLDQTFAVLADAAVTDAAGVNVSIAPALPAGVSANDAVVRKASHVVNLAFTREAFAYANRPLADVVVSSGNIISSMVDPQTNIALRLEVSRQNKQTRWAFDTLYGAKLVRAECAARVMG